MPDQHDTEVIAEAIGQYYRDHLPLPPLPDMGIMDWLHTFWDWWSSYTLAALLMFYGSIDTIVSWGGFILLIVRLIADVPRAARQIKEWINGKR